METKKYLMNLLVEYSNQDNQKEENEKVSGKKYQRIKKRKLISKGEPGISVTTIVLICVGAVVLLGAIAAGVIIVIRKKKA